MNAHLMHNVNVRWIRIFKVYLLSIFPCLFSNLVSRTQLIDGQDLSSAESLPKQVNCPHLAAEDTVGIGRLGRSQETLVKCL